MQLLLAILIAVTQIAGPWLCCCGPARFASTFAAEAPIPPSPAKKTPAAHCPHCVTENPADGAPTPPKHKPVPAERCPCGGLELVAIPTAVSTASFDLDHLVPVVPAFDAAVVIEIALPVEPTGLRELPFFTTADKLYAHHVLRC